MVEKSYARKGHSDVILIASGHNMVVANRAASLRNKVNAAFVGTFDVVAEGEESITAQTNTIVLGNPLAFLLQRKGFGLAFEELLPRTVCQNVFALIADVKVDGVIAVGTLNVVDKGQIHHLGMLAQPPRIGLVACQTRAMYATLLTGTNADGLPVLNVTHRIALRIFKGDKGNDEVAKGLRRKMFVPCGDVLKQFRVV